MQTSNFWQYPTGSNRIIISQAVPDSIESGYKCYPKLAPGVWFKNPEYKNNAAAFEKRYFAEILGHLNPQKEWENLHQLTGGTEPVLLCWEPLKKTGEYCHRRMVAKWFEETLGVTVHEYKAVQLKSDSQLVLL